MNLPSKKVKGRKLVPGDVDHRGLVRPEDQGPGSDLPEISSSPPPDAQPERSLGRKIAYSLVQIAICVLLIWAGREVYKGIIAAAPTAERTARERVPRLVEVTEVSLAQQGPAIEAWGEVTPAQTLVVRPEISGTLLWVNPSVTPGGLLKANETAARFDDRDLKLAVLRAEADIADIKARMLLEEGQAAIGERELSRLSRNLTEAQRALVLREPQKAQLKAELASAEAALQQARNALDRAEVKVLFDALVISEGVAPGSTLAQGAEAATLVAADRFHVVLAVPASALDWLDIEDAPTVTLTQPGVWPEGTSREGNILRLDAGLSETGRMAELIVEVTDPLSLQPENANLPKLLLRSFIRGTLTGSLSRLEAKGLIGADAQPIDLDRELVREDDTAWVMTAEDQLEVRELTVLWRGPEHVLISAGLAPGDRVISTPLASFAPGMALRTRGDGE